MAREGKRGILFLKARAEKTVLEELWLTVSPPAAIPSLGCRKRRREVHSSFGRTKSPKGPLKLTRPPRP